MPDRIWTFFNSLPVPVQSALLATVIAFLRVMYDDKEPRFWRRGLEAALCGMIALGVASGAEALGLSAKLSTFIGGAIGLYGADQIRSWGRAIVQRRIGKAEPYRPAPTKRNRRAVPVEEEREKEDVI